MAPLAASLARSESKAKFLQRIGLDENNRAHRDLYSKMKAEASDGWQRMISNRDALVDSLRGDATVEPPYTYGQIRESAMRAEVAHIYKIACPETRIMYNLAHDGDVAVLPAVAADNWIIRWLLWHVFRYRDDRNGVVHRQRSHFHPVAFRPRPPLSQNNEEAEEEDLVATAPGFKRTAASSPSLPLVLAPLRSLPPLSPQALTTASPSPHRQHVGRRAKYWDPIRDG